MPVNRRLRGSVRNGGNSAGAFDSGFRWFEADFVIYGVAESLFAAEVSFGRLDAHMAKQELNLFKFPTRFMTETRACAAKVVRCHILQTTFRASGFHDTPDHLRTKSAFGNPLGLVDRPEDGAGSDSRGSQPSIDGRFDPSRHRDRPHVTTLAYKIGDYPVLFSLLHTLDRQRRRLRSPKATPEEDGDHRVVTLTAQASGVYHRKKSSALLRAQPIANPDPVLLDTFDTADPGHEVRAEEPAVCCLVCKPPNRCKAKVDSGRRVLLLLEVDSVACDYGLVECETGFGAVPVDELANGVVIRSLRTAGREAVEDGGFRLFEIRQFQDGFGSEFTLFISHSCSLQYASKPPDASRAGWDDHNS